MNYILEGDGNFNTQLMKALCNEEINVKDQLCLISNKPLEDNHITLSCNHKFNYTPLFHEVKKQKKIINRLEIQKLKKYQIKCPYCRNIQDNILPYRNTEARIFAVNWPPKYALLPFKCKALFKTGKRKGIICKKPCSQEFCNLHLKYLHTNSKLLTTSTIITPSCSAVLKSGKNKGQKCPCKARFSGFCGRHKS